VTLVLGLVVLRIVTEDNAVTLVVATFDTALVVEPKVDVKTFVLVAVTVVAIVAFIVVFVVFLVLLAGDGVVVATIGYCAYEAIPQWLFLFRAILIYPCSPHSGPQLFFLNLKNSINYIKIVFAF
jgi:hypothetical protein